ncbi:MULTISPECIES: hypothetical protein [unclassified Paenibacillus]|uniref:hypothetical protein n=1 Tax=unclassified Paenibacillus TaxID=185978 RepID=UPI001AE29809|nr:MULTISPECIES: hypothetical protein [unclassified Paenibacillus]MBP1154947.1 hypothetical protein [Paenibacillus sp. PvP091]MBP1169669.1 hypothetical protein [Paenibacillus sp. PvR098]MBP2440697.1 hypothetical protein [Paenibacillus sp. PvP052]
MDHNMEMLIDLFDKYTNEQMADLSDFSYEGRNMTRDETLVIVSTLRASRIARGYINGGRTRQRESN